MSGVQKLCQFGVLKFLHLILKEGLGKFEFELRPSSSVDHNDLVVADFEEALQISGLISLSEERLDLFEAAIPPDEDVVK